MAVATAQPKSADAPIRKPDAIDALLSPSRAYTVALVAEQLPADKTWSHVNVGAEDAIPGEPPEGFDTKAFEPLWIAEKPNLISGYIAGRYTSKIPCRFVTKAEFGKPGMIAGRYFDSDGLVRDTVHGLVLLYMPRDLWKQHQECQRREQTRYLDSQPKNTADANPFDFLDKGKQPSGLTTLLEKAGAGTIKADSGVSMTREPLEDSK